MLAGGFDPSASGLPRRCSANGRSEQNGAPCMESNLRPAAYKAAALPTELTEHGASSVNRTPGRPPARAPLGRLSQTSKIDKRTGILPCTVQRGSRIIPVQFWTFHFFKQLGRRATRTQKSPQWPAPRGPTRSCRLGVLGHLPLSRLVRRRGWPCAGYSGLVNPSSGVFVCWNKISTHACRQSLGRLLGRAVVIVTRYERIERMVPHRAAKFVVIGAVKIKAIVSSFGDSRRIKRLLRKTDDRG